MSLKYTIYKARSISEKWYTDFTDLGKEGVWKSFTFGDEAVYTNWIKGNPSNSNSREHCVEINCEYLGLWNDVPCEAVLKFVCESYGKFYKFMKVLKVHAICLHDI